MVNGMHRLALAATLGLAGILGVPAYAQTTNAQTPNGSAPNGSAPAGQKASPQKSAATAPAAAAAVTPPKRLVAVDSWVAYSSPEKGGEICYIVGQPTKSEPTNAKRDPVHLLVTHNTADKTSNVVSFIAGYKFKDGSDAPLAIGDKSFSLFTKDDTAWARDAATDKAIVTAMLKGKQAVIKGNPAKGSGTTDTYSLAGFSKVLEEIDKACKIKR
jgi:hypothetical protein